jgi:carbon-monoxide dehydrogenase medium subunit
MHTAHPTLPPFDYVRPASLREASDFLAHHPGEARILLGGTDTFVRMRNGDWRPRYLVDVKHLEGLKALVFDPNAGLTVGAAVSLNRLMALPEVRTRYSVLAQAGHTVASYPLRNRATVVGNACNASPAGDTLGACLVLDGSLRIFGIEGERTEPLAQFFLGPGRTTLKPGEIVTALHLPIPPVGAVARYRKLGRNALGDLAIVGVTALGHPDEETPSGYRFRIALTSVAPTPLRPEEAQHVLSDKPITEESLTDAAEAAMEACAPIDDVRGSARYRRLMVRNLTQHVLMEVWKKLSEA